MSFTFAAFKILLWLSVFFVVYQFSLSFLHYFERSIQTNHSGTNSNQWIAGDIVFCRRLRHQKQENYTYLNETVNVMSRSYAVILDPSMNQAQDRVNIAWLGDKTRSISCGVKPKYLRPISRLVFHVMTSEENPLGNDLFLNKFMMNHHQIHAPQWVMYPLEDRVMVKRRQKYRWQLKRDVTREDMSLLHLIEEWYDRSYNSTDDMHVAIRAPTSSFNQENLLRLCRMMYQDNLWKRQSFGKVSKSGDMKLIRRLLKRQVHFIVHSTYEEIWVLAQVIFDFKRTNVEHNVNFSKLLSKYLAETIKKKFVSFCFKNLVPEM